MTSETVKRAGVRIYRAAAAPDLGATDFNAKTDLGPCTRQDVADALAGTSPTVTRLLVRQTPAEGGFSLVYLFYKPHFPLFRHKHESDCMYVVLSGSAVMGNQTLRAGDCFFVPANAPYGYTAGPDGVEVLEVRHQVDSITTTVATDPSSWLDKLRAAAGENAATWNGITAGPMYVANAAEG